MPPFLLTFGVVLAVVTTSTPMGIATIADARYYRENERADFSDLFTPAINTPRGPLGGGGEGFFPNSAVTTAYHWKLQQSKKEASEGGLSGLIHSIFGGGPDSSANDRYPTANVPSVVPQQEEQQRNDASLLNQNRKNNDSPSSGNQQLDCSLFRETKWFDDSDFAGYIDRPLVGRCNKRGFLRTPNCWANTCGITALCSDAKPYCVCMRGWEGERCEIACKAGKCDGDELDFPPATTASTTAMPTTTAKATTTATTIKPTTTATTSTTTDTPPTTTTATTTPTTTVTTTTTSTTTATTPSSSSTSTTTQETSTAATTTTTTATATTTAATTATTTSTQAPTSTAAPTTTSSPTPQEPPVTEEDVQCVMSVCNRTENDSYEYGTGFDGYNGKPTVPILVVNSTEGEGGTTTSTATFSSSSTASTTPTTVTSTTETTTATTTTQTDTTTTDSTSTTTATTTTTDATTSTSATSTVTDSSSTETSTQTSASTPTSTSTLLAPTSTTPAPSGGDGYDGNNNIAHQPVAADDGDLINSFIAQSQDQYFATLPLRFGLGGSTLATLLASILRRVYESINGITWVQVDYTVAIANVAPPKNPPAPTPAFSAAVAALPPTYAGNEQQYQRFLEHFGTHVITNYTLGARLVVSDRRSRCKESMRVILGGSVDRVRRWAMMDGSMGATATASAAGVEITAVVGGPAGVTPAVMRQRSFAWWRAQITKENAVRIGVDMVRVSDPLLIPTSDVAGRARAAQIDLAIRDLGPEETSFLILLLECIAEKLSAGAIAGIAIACGVALAIGITVFVYCYIKNRPDNTHGADGDVATSTMAGDGKWGSGVPPAAAGGTATQTVVVGPYQHQQHPHPHAHIHTTTQVVHADGEYADGGPSYMYSPANGPSPSAYCDSGV